MRLFQNKGGMGDYCWCPKTIHRRYSHKQRHFCFTFLTVPLHKGHMWLSISVKKNHLDETVDYWPQKQLLKVY